VGSGTRIDRTPAAAFVLDPDWLPVNFIGRV